VLLIRFSVYRSSPRTTVEETLQVTYQAAAIMLLMAACLL